MSENSNKIITERFGEIFYNNSEVLTFPRGIPAFEDQEKWILVGNEDSAVKWLQSVNDGDLALPVTTPDAIQPDYNARIPDDELALISDNKACDPADLALLIVVSIPDSAPWNMTANLRAPILINLKTRKAVQVIVLNEEYPIRHIVFPDEVRNKMKASAIFESNNNKNHKGARE